MKLLSGLVDRFRTKFWNMRQLTLSICFIFVLLSASAQVTFDWDDQGISFTLPNDFVVVNDGEFEFEAEGDGMEFGLYVFNDDELDADDVADLTFELASSLDLEEVDDAEEIELNGFLGAYVLGYLDGDAIFLLGLMDPDTDTNFYATVTFFDDDDEAEATAFQILESIVRI